MEIDNEEVLSLLFKASAIIFCLSFVFKIVIVKLQNYTNKITAQVFIVNFLQLLVNVLCYFVYVKVLDMNSLTQYLFDNRVMFIALTTLVELLVIIAKSMFYKKYITDDEDKKRINGLRIGVIIIKIGLYLFIPTTVLAIGTKTLETVL